MKAFFKIIAAIGSSLAEQVRQVNRKYAKPELQMTRFMKISLLVLRIYLLAMIGMMGYFLVQQVRSLGHG